MLPPIGSRKSPIYRARISVFTHKKGGGNVRAVVWMHVFGNVDMRVRWCEYTYLIMLGYGHDESVPYVWRNVRCAFHGLFVGILRNVLCVFRWCSPRYRNPSAAVGVRFIAPAYTYTPTKWQTEMRVRWCGNVYLIMQMHVFGNVDMRVR